MLRVNMNVLLLVAVLLQRPDDAAGHFTAVPPTCPGDTVTFRCTVGGDNTTITTWRVGGSGKCPLLHGGTASSVCGPGNNFAATPETGFGTNATSFSSTLSVTATPALNGTLIECFGPGSGGDLGNRVGDSIMHVLGPPPLPSLSCVGLSEVHLSRAVNVTVSWTMSGGDSADFYLMNIYTNDPQPPYGGLLNITTASVTQRELTGFQAGYQYTITVRGVNCGRQEGSESEPLTITPQVPDIPASCNVSVVYKQSSGMLLAVNSVWDAVPNQDMGIACPGSSGNTSQYQIYFEIGPHFREYEDTFRCADGKCKNTFQPFMNSRSRYDSVSVVAENVVGMGGERTCTAQPIDPNNNFLIGDVINGTLTCTFLSGFTGSARCRVQYGPDPTYRNLPYSAESNETGTAGETVSVILRDRLNSSTEYYFTVSAVVGDITVTVQAKPFHLIVPEYSCILSGWNITLIVIGAVALVVTIVLAIIVKYGGSFCKSLKLYERKALRRRFILVLLVSSLFLLTFGVLLWILYGMVSDAPNNSCELPRLTPFILVQYVIYSLSLVDVVPVMIIETVCICCECYRHEGDRFERWLRVVYRVFVVVACVLYTIGGILWIVVQLTVTIPPSGINTSSPVATWQIVLLVVGGISLGIVIIVTVFVHRRQQKYHKYDKVYKLEWWKSLYIFLWVVAVAYCAIGLALFITVGVVLRFTPPNGNVFDRCLCGYHDGQVIAGFLFSVLALIYAMAALVFVVHRVKDEKQPSGKRATYCTVVTMILLCLSVVGFAIIIAECWKKIKKGYMGGTDGRHEEVELLYLEPTVNKEVEGGAEGGSGKPENSQVQQSLAVPNPSDPNYIHLKEDASLPSAENDDARYQPS